MLSTTTPNVRQRDPNLSKVPISFSVYYVFCAEKKEYKTNTNGIVQDLQVTNLCLSICGQDAFIKLRSPRSHRSLLATPYKDIRLAIQKYIYKERVVMAERAQFLFVIQGLGGSDDDFVARLREKARYFVFEKLKTAANLEEELVKIKFISDLRDPEAKLRQLDSIKAKSSMSFTEIKENLQFRSLAMAFASSSSGNKLFTVKEAVGFNFKKTF